MKIFVAGATGVLGTRSVRLLAEAGHDVVGVARTPEKEDFLRSLGATPSTADLFDREQARDALFGCEAVINLATKIPKFTKMRWRGQWKENDRLRREASRVLADAAAENGIDLYVQESITFIYADGGDQWLSEEAPLDVSWISLESMLEAEKATSNFAAGRRRGVNLRFGLFYGPNIDSTIETAKMARTRTFSIPGKGLNYMSSIHVDDAASAVARSLNLLSGDYNVVDDEPLQFREFAAVLAKSVGKSLREEYPPSMPAWLFKLVLGGPAKYLLRSQRVSNRKFKEATGWAPAYPNAREGWQQVVRETDWPGWMDDVKARAS